MRTRSWRCGAADSARRDLGPHLSAHYGSSWLNRPLESIQCCREQHNGAVMLLEVLAWVHVRSMPSNHRLGSVQSHARELIPPTIGAIEASQEGS